MEDTVTAQVSPDSHNNIARTDNRREAMFQDLVNKEIDEKEIYV